MSSPLSKPLISVSPDNQGASVAVTNYVLLSLTIFVVVTRLITMCVLKRRPDFGDLFSIVAAVLALLQSVIVQLAINHGLGRHRDKISSSNFVLFSKYEYAGEILVILVLVCAKISIALLIQRLTPQTRFVRSTWLVMMVVLGWGIFSVLGLAFQCGVHQPWISAPDKCVKNGALFAVITVFNILTDFVLVILPVYMMSTVQLPRTQKSLIMGVFSIRILVCIVAALQLDFLITYANSTDQTWAIVNSTICNQVMMNLSVITACLPYLHRFIMDLSAGLLGTHIPEHLELSASQKRTILGSKDLNSRTLDIAGLGKSIVTNNRSQNKSQFSTSTRQGQDEESDSIKRLTHGEVLCTTDIRIDIEESRVDMDRKVAYAY